MLTNSAFTIGWKFTEAGTAELAVPLPVGGNRFQHHITEIPFNGERMAVHVESLILVVYAEG